MKNLIQLFVLILLTVGSINVFGQRETPAGAGDTNLASDGIKMRSVEIERLKKEAQAAEAASFAPINTEISKKFPQIKEDFEDIQILQDAIIKAYTTEKKINYKIIESSADGINIKAKRLDTNLFSATKKDKVIDKTLEKEEKTKSMKDLIIDLDTAIGSFVSSKIFGNIKVIEADVAIKTRTDLLHILQISEKISAEAKKLK